MNFIMKVPCLGGSRTPCSVDPRDLSSIVDGACEGSHAPQSTKTFIWYFDLKVFSNITNFAFKSSLNANNHDFLKIEQCL